ncbi:MAG: hypothetical protein KDD37_07900 [Bdellovibrionales bacterium]|nr:hypothetical protein [Bdellovibrionales bacterium]
MTQNILVLLLSLVFSISIQAKEMPCDANNFPAKPADSSVKGHIYCLKSCGPKQGYIYLVQDTEKHWGKNNDRARFKLVRSKFVATTKGPYGNQRIAQKAGEVKCLAANRLTPALAAVSTLKDEDASQREINKANKVIAKIPNSVKDEASDVLEQIRLSIASAECEGDDGITFKSSSDDEKYARGISVTTDSKLATMSYQGAKDEVFQCQGKSADLIKKVASNLSLYRPNANSGTASEGAR